MSKVTIELDAKWQKFVRSRLFHIVAAVQGISITFAPFLLYWTGKNSTLQAYEWVVVPVCFALVFIIPFFYFKLGAAVIRELLKD